MAPVASRRQSPARLPEPPAPLPSSVGRGVRRGGWPSGDRARDLRDRMTRMRAAPRLWDPCWFTTRANLAVLQRMGARLAGVRGARVLDVGCGRKPLRGLFPSGCEFVGLDLGSDSAADVAVDVSQGWPLGDASVDAVILSEVLEHLPDPRGALEEACRVLKPGGELFVSSPFAFPIHGRPRDFCRFTEFYYRRLPEELPLSIEGLRASNTVFTTPVLAMQQILLSAPVPWFLKQVGWFLSNLLVALPDRVAARGVDPWGKGDLRAIHGRLGAFLHSNPAGYSVLMRRR